ncbi:MAG: dual specificity protein phosphatase family protein [Actinobacteria bacterium]|nr:dual specificity protein phosphatase family protein [Actinomycetota bacterium]
MRSAPNRFWATVEPDHYGEFDLAGFADESEASAGDVEAIVDALEAPRHAGVEYPSWRGDEIAPGLFMGGTRDDDTIDLPARLRDLGERGEYDAVVTLYAWAQPVDWEVEELRYGFGDGALAGPDIARVVRAAAWAHQRWRSGDRVLIRCQAGLNRSGLVSALVLVIEGWEPDVAIRRIRDRRSPYALFNSDFVRWLVADSAAAVARLQAGAYAGR